MGKGKTDLLLVANGPCIPGTPLVVRDTGIFLNFWGYPAAPCLPCLNPCALTNCSVASVACQLGQPQRPFVGGMTGFRDNPPPPTHTPQASVKTVHSFLVPGTQPTAFIMACGSEQMKTIGVGIVSPRPGKNRNQLTLRKPHRTQGGERAVEWSPQVS